MFPREYKIISETVRICDEYCSLQATTLSYSAKAHYILVNGDKDGYTIDDVQEAAKKFEWEISTHDAEKGMTLLEKLNLVHIS